MEYYTRKIEKKLEKWLKRREIILIRGPRQAGKTTLLLHLKNKLQAEYITLEDFEWKDALEKDVKSFIKRISKPVLLLDEAQYVKDIGRGLKLIYDTQEKKIIVTGSGSFDIKTEIGKYLVGRAVYFELLPLSFDEFLMWKAKDLHKIFVDNLSILSEFIENGKLSTTPIFEKEFRQLLEEYVLYGGFPAIVKENDYEIKKELLKNLVKTYLEKDVFFFFGIRHLDKFRDFLRMLSFNMGEIFNISSVSQTLGIDYSTVNNYTTILQETYITKQISPFFKNLNTEIRKSRKIYFIDSGLRNSLINNFLPLESRNDMGKLLENFVFRELLSLEDLKINFWRTTGKAEIDFIITVKNNLIPIEVKTNEVKISKGFQSFIKTYKPKIAIVFTFKKFKLEKIGTTKIAYIPHFFI